jgi:stage V sporulation protein B
VTTSERDDQQSGTEPPGAPRSGDAAARKAGRGGLAIAFAKIYFMFTGLAQQVALGNLLVGGGYGALSTVMGIASITYNPLVQTGIQGVSRPVAPASDAERPAVIRTALRVHYGLGIAVAVLFVLVSPVIAEATNAPYLTNTFRLFGGVLLAYALYGPLVGIVNGRQRFGTQAGLDMLAATLRTAFMVGGAWWFVRTGKSGSDGAGIGFGVSAGSMFVVAAFIAGFGRAGASALSTGAHLRFIGPLLLGQFILNLLFQADLQLLGAFARDAAAVAGKPPEAADQLVGAYRASQLFAFLPYQLLIAVSFVLFPLLARAKQDGDAAAVRQYVRGGVRIAVVLAGLAVGIGSGLAPQLLRLVFPSQPFDEIGGDAMRVLTVGLGAFAIFGILTTVLNSLGHERWATVLTAAAFAAIASLCFAFVRGEAFGPGLLQRTAMATTAAHFAATGGAALLVKRAAGGVVAGATVARVALATVLTVALGRQLPDVGKLATLGWAATLAVAYVLILAATRELGRADLGRLAGLVGRR